MSSTKAIIFDMDGVIIDSEPLWKKAEILVFKQYGYDFTYEMCEETKGMRIDEVTKYWKKKLNADFNPEEVETKIVHAVIQLIKQEGKALPGLIELLDELKQLNYRVAIASSSPLKIIQAVVDALNIEAYFEVIHSAEFEEYGKPHPQVFITASKKLHVQTDECIIIEDSLNGIIAALAAQIKVIALPSAQEPKINKFVIAHKIAKSHHEILQNEWFK